MGSGLQCCRGGVGTVKGSGADCTHGVELGEGTDHVRTSGVGLGVAGQGAWGGWGRGLQGP